MNRKSLSIEGSSLSTLYIFAKFILISYKVFNHPSCFKSTLEYCINVVLLIILNPNDLCRNKIYYHSSPSIIYVFIFLWYYVMLFATINFWRRNSYTNVSRQFFVKNNLFNYFGIMQRKYLKSNYIFTFLSHILFLV